MGQLPPSIGQCLTVGHRVLLICAGLFADAVVGEDYRARTGYGNESWVLVAFPLSSNILLYSNKVRQPRLTPHMSCDIVYLNNEVSKLRLLGRTPGREGHP